MLELNLWHAKNKTKQNLLCVIEDIGPMLKAVSKSCCWTLSFPHGNGKCAVSDSSKEKVKQDLLVEKMARRKSGQAPLHP